MDLRSDPLCTVLPWNYIILATSQYDSSTVLVKLSAVRNIVSHSCSTDRLNFGDAHLYAGLEWCNGLYNEVMKKFSTLFNAFWNNQPSIVPPVVISTCTLKNDIVLVGSCKFDCAVGHMSKRRCDCVVYECKVWT